MDYLDPQANLEPVIAKFCFAHLRKRQCNEFIDSARKQEQSVRHRRLVGYFFFGLFLFTGENVLLDNAVHF